MNTSDNVTESETIMKLGESMEQLFDRLIVDMELSERTMTDACRELGAKHCLYVDGGIDDRMWKAFTVSYQ